MNILKIDTADNKKISVGLKINDKEYIRTQTIKSNKTQIVLPMIDRLLKKQGMSLKELTLIEVNIGPGSFTGIRVGMAIANALSFTLKIPTRMIK
jgi:tRNA threonylcarbamoyladenosine biosynthesis protein TsaB